MNTLSSSLHDSYAADYDHQVQACDCHIAEVLFGLCYEFVQPRQCLLDLGIGSGLSAALFAKARLKVHGLDFSPAMLEICRQKGITTELKQHDLAVTPWPYPASHFDHLVACGVFHFIPELESILAEAARLLKPGGRFAFTTRFPTADLQGKPYTRHLAGDFEIFSHSQHYIEAMLKQSALTRLKLQKCFIGDDIFLIWVTQKS